MRMIFPISFILLIFVSSAWASIVDDQLDSCKGDPNEAYCAAKILLDAINKMPGGGTSEGPPKCRCSCGGAGPQKTCTLYYIDGVNSATLATDITPRDCVEALRYPPCRE